MRPMIRYFEFELRF